MRVLFTVGFFNVLLLLSQTTASPLGRRVAPNLHVINDSEESEGCTAEQIAVLKASLTNAASQLERAAQVLSQTGAIDSEGVKTWLGTITPEQLTEGIQQRFRTNAASMRGNVADATDLATGGSDLNFECLGSTGANSLAVTSNLLDGANANFMQLPETFFDGITTAAGVAASVQTDVAAYLAKKKGGLENQFTAPRSPVHNLLHESQHSLPLLQSTTVSDNLEDLTQKNKNTPISCSSLAAAKRRLNAENWAIVAFLANADPTRFAPPPAEDPCEESSTGPKTRKSGRTRLGKRAAKTPPASCPLPAKSANGKAVTTGPTAVTAKKTATKSATGTAAKKAAPVKKTAVKKAAPVKKTAVKKATPVKKTAVKKAAPVKKVAAVKKAPVKKAAPVRKAPVKKAPVKKAPIKKPARGRK